MPHAKDSVVVKCSQCDWLLQLQPARNQGPQEAECPAQPCPVCGTEETIIEFLHEAEDCLSHLASHIRWPRIQ